LNIYDEDLKQKLSKEQYRYLREGKTEPPFSGKFLNHNQEGTYICAACGNELFSSKSKHDTQTPGLTGWPSFADVVDSGSIELVDDDSHGMHRIEVKCAKCGSHLGHLFDDSSIPGGKHYCINSVCLDFESKTKPN
jgi:peptide-methionine (R)-S-oxide reductase